MITVILSYGLCGVVFAIIGSIGTMIKQDLTRPDDHE